MSARHDRKATLRAPIRYGGPHATSVWRRLDHGKCLTSREFLLARERLRGQAVRFRSRAWAFSPRRIGTASRTEAGVSRHPVWPQEATTTIARTIRQQELGATRSPPRLMCRSGSVIRTGSFRLRLGTRTERDAPARAAGTQGTRERRPRGPRIAGSVRYRPEAPRPDWERVRGNARPCAHPRPDPPDR